MKVDETEIKVMGKIGYWIAVIPVMVVGFFVYMGLIVLQFPFQLCVWLLNKETLEHTEPYWTLAVPMKKAFGYDYKGKYDKNRK